VGDEEQAYIHAAPWAIDYKSLMFFFVVKVLGGEIGFLPASSVTIDLPTGCVAPVTTHTKPYC
jgi:hypothetical protein